MPLNKPDEPIPLNFHPGYETPENWAIIQSNDEVCFRFNIEAFGQYSSFFANIAGIPTPVGASQAMPLPDTSAKAPKFIVDAINWLVRHSQETHTPLPAVGVMSFKRYSPPPTLDGDVITMEEIVAFANSFELTVVLGPLYEAIKRQPWDPSILFAFCASTGFGNLTYWSAKLVAQGQQGIHPKAVQILDADQPEALGSLNAFLRQWERTYQRFCVELNAIPYDVTGKSFSRPCKAIRCATYTKYQGNYTHFLRDFIVLLMAFARSNIYAMVSDGLGKFCAEHIACTRCARRIELNVQRAWAKHMKRKDWTLSLKPKRNVGYFPPPGYWGIRTDDADDYIGRHGSKRCNPLTMKRRRRMAV